MVIQIKPLSAANDILRVCVPILKVSSLMPQAFFRLPVQRLRGGNLQVRSGPVHARGKDHGVAPECCAGVRAACGECRLGLPAGMQVYALIPSVELSPAISQQVRSITNLTALDFQEF